MVFPTSGESHTYAVCLWNFCKGNKHCLLWKNQLPEADNGGVYAALFHKYVKGLKNDCKNEQGSVECDTQNLRAWLIFVFISTKYTFHDLYII